MAVITHELAEATSEKLRDHYGVGVGVGTSVRQGLRRALEGTGHEVKDTSIVEGRNDAETVKGERINYSWDTFGGGGGAGEAGVVVVVNSIGGEYIADAELYEAIEQAEFTANTLSEDEH